MISGIIEIEISSDAILEGKPNETKQRLEAKRRFLITNEINH